jgi:glucokinase
MHWKRSSRVPLATFRVGSLTDRDVSIGIDIGGTKVLGVTVDANAKVLDRERASSLKDGRRDPGLNISLGVAERLRLRAEERGDVLLSVGIGVPEYVNEAGLLTSRLVMEWDVQVLDLFGHLGRVEVESDVRCAAIAESILGAGRSLTSFLYVSIGTGISSCLVLDGQPWRGTRGEAIAFGELVVARSKNGGVGVTLEEFASGAGMCLRYSEATGRGVLGAEELMALAEAGDAEAQDILATSLHALGAALTAAVDILDPSALIVGGGLGTSGGFWWDHLSAEYRAGTAKRPGAPPLLESALGSDAGAIGAALHAKK